jgi:fatty-acyl-CoA synthase
VSIGVGMGSSLASKRPVPLVDLRVVDEVMKDVPHDGKISGEIVSRGPWLTMGYLGNLSASEKLWEGGYLHTGDIGTMTAQGVVQITDRMKDVIKTGGEWISSIGHPDAHARPQGGGNHRRGRSEMGRTPVGNSGDSASRRRHHKAAVQAHVKGYADKGVISRFAIPDRILFVDGLDKTSVGKIDKKALWAKYGDG